MKKIFITTLLAGFLSSSFAQTFMGTLKAGSAANSVMMAIKPGATFSGQITAVEFVLQVPNTVATIPIVTIKSNPLSAYIPAYTAAPPNNEGGYYTYLFAATTFGSPVYNFTINTEIDALELQMSGVSP